MAPEKRESARLYPHLQESDAHLNEQETDTHLTNGDQVPDRESSDTDDSVADTSPVPQKSLFLTYVLWLTCGWFGLHHVYLGRDRHAFTTWITFGLYFGIGWFRELWRIPEYVRDANEEPEHMKQLKRQMERHEPPVSWARSCGSIIVADILGYLIIGAIPGPEVMPEWVKQLLVAATAPGACALGVHLIGNIGRHSGGLKFPLMAAYATLPLYLLFGSNCVFWSSLAANYAFGKYARRWRKSYDRKRGFMKRLVVLSLAGLLYASLWGSWFCFNCSFEKEGESEPVKCRDAAANFFNSPFWQEFGSVMKDLYNYAWHHGLWDLWQEIVNALDPYGEVNAAKVLGLNDTQLADQEQITTQYRKLIRVWHPDRHKDPVEREAASQKFMQIQAAYETLSRIKSRRMQQSRNSAAPDFEREKLEL